MVIYIEIEGGFNFLNNITPSIGESVRCYCIVPLHNNTHEYTKLETLILPQQGCCMAKLETLTLSLLTTVECYRPMRLIST